ncbi:hypothetical protein O6P43_032199 [Quillaja saponaria]|uniref:Uncharacterized protein n=1 Tax=Quillaja saponaria TaxID=32244 RepID=A0AAD7KWZ1_QUISA|nr:hypothetical protein O6P43_032199 [Quillaja saponaria]
MVTQTQVELQMLETKIKGVQETVQRAMNQRMDEQDTRIEELSQQNDDRLRQIMKEFCRMIGGVNPNSNPNPPGNNGSGIPGFKGVSGFQLGGGLGGIAGLYFGQQVREAPILGNSQIPDMPREMNGV